MLEWSKFMADTRQGGSEIYTNSTNSTFTNAAVQVLLPRIRTEGQEIHIETFKRREHLL